MRDLQSNGTTRPRRRVVPSSLLVGVLVLAGVVVGLQAGTASRAGASPHMAYLPVAPRAHFSPGAAPVLLSPANLANLQTLVPQLAYDAGNDPDASESAVQVAVDEEFQGILLDGLAGTPRGRVNYTVWFNLEPSTTYYWRTWLNYGQDQGPFSEAWSFTTGSSGIIPQSPNPLDPADGGRVFPGQVLLDWSAVAEAQSYEVNWGRQSMQYFEHSLSVDSASARVAATERGTVYQWRVRARTGYAWSDWSETFTFTTANVEL
jgi:hypothetical protein